MSARKKVMEAKEKDLANVRNKEKEKLQMNAKVTNLKEK